MIECALKIRTQGSVAHVSAMKSFNINQKLFSITKFNIVVEFINQDQIFVYNLTHLHTYTHAERFLKYYRRLLNFFPDKIA